VAAIVNGSMELCRKKLKDAQLEETITNKFEEQFTRPDKWKPTTP
jgi:hypothetical protein